MIYQIFVGRWKQASLKYHPGKVFSQLRTFDWQAVKQLGFDCIYLLGIFDNSGPVIVDDEEYTTLNQELRLPSVFALSDHRAINPQIGSSDDLLLLIDTIHSADLKVWTDFVPNHRSTNHVWLDTHPDYFSYTENGHPIKEFSGDVVKLNYNNQFLEEQMIQTVLFIQNLGFDGIRCDMAHYVPLDFWKKAISISKTKNSKFTFAGEVYPNSNYELDVYQDFSDIGFDYLYHGVLLNNLDAFFSGALSLDSIVEHLTFIQKQEFGSKLLHYFANHDDFLPQVSIYREALTGLLLFLKGETLFFNGSLHFLDKRLSHHQYEDLDSDNVNFTRMPLAMQRLFKFKHREVSFEKMKSIGANVLQIEGASINNTNWIAYLNLGNSDYKLSHPDEKAVGLIHDLSSDSQLSTGLIEIFIVENTSQKRLE